MTRWAAGWDILSQVSAAAPSVIWRGTLRLKPISVLETSFLGPLLKPALHVLATAVLGVLLAGALIRMAPGFGIDEREFDLRLNDDSVRRIRAGAGAGRSLWSFYVAYGRGLATGDLKGFKEQPASDTDPEEVGKVSNKLDAARVKLAQEKKR